MELLSAGQAILLTGAGHAGEEAEQQEVRKQDFHGAGAGSKMLKHKEGCVAIRTAIVWRPVSAGDLTQGMQERHSLEGTVPGPEIHLARGSGLSRPQGARFCQPGLLFVGGGVVSVLLGRALS